MSIVVPLLLDFSVMFVLVMFEFCLVVFLRMRRARDAPAAEAANYVEQFFQDDALAPAPRCRGRGSSGRGVLSHVVYV